MCSILSVRHLPLPCRGSHSSCSTAPWGWGLAGVTEGLPVPNGSGCCRGATSTPRLAHSWVRLQEVAEMGWGTTLCVLSFCCLCGWAGRRSLGSALVCSQAEDPWRDACVGSWAPPWAGWRWRAWPLRPPGTGVPTAPLQVGVRSQGGSAIPGWEPGVAGRGALCLN